MKQVLVYGDSQVWGRVPRAEPVAARHAFADRWPMQLETLLGRDRVRITDQGINGRRTVFDDPFRPYRNGADYLDYTLHCHAPLDLVVIWLGTNDLQFVHRIEPFESGLGIGRLIDIVQAWRGEPLAAPPPVLVCAPPRIAAPSGWLSERFRGAPEKSRDLAAAYLQVCMLKGVHFFDASEVASPDPADGIHLDRATNHAIAAALEPVVANLLDLS